MFCSTVNIGEYIFCAYIVVSLIVSINPRPRTKTCFVLILACLELLKSAPRIIVFLPSPPSGCVNFPFELNAIPYPEYYHVSVHQINNF